MSTLSTDKTKSMSGLWLAAGLAGLAIVGWQHFVAQSPEQAISEWGYRIGLALLLFGHFYYVRDKINRLSFKDAPQLLQPLFYLSLGAAVFLLPSLLNYFEATISSSAKVNTFFSFLQTYVFHLYAITALHLLYRLILLDNNEQTLTVTRTFSGFLAFAVMVTVFMQNVQEALYLLFFLPPALMAVFLATRLKWIAYLEPSAKWNCIWYLLPLAAVNILLVYHYVSYPDAYFFDAGRQLGLYYFSMLLFLVGYSTVALTAMLFYLPVASVIDQRTREMKNLVELGNIGGKQLDAEKIFDRLLTSALNDTQSQAGWLNLDMNGSGKILKTRNLNIKQVNHLNGPLTHYLTKKPSQQTAMQISNLQEAGILEADRPAEFKSLLVAGITIDKRKIGELCLLKPLENGYNASMVETVNTYANQAQLAYQNNLLQEKSQTTEQLNKELQIAKRIQQRLIPKSFPKSDAFDIQGFIEPSREVGGDFYDYYELDENRLALVIGDVSGKGISSALYMAEIKGIFQSLVQFDLSPEELIDKANSAISKCFDKHVFVTLTYAILDKSTKNIRYIRAGHCPTLFFDAAKNEAAYLDDKGMGMGILRSGQFKDHIKTYEKAFQAGDVMVLFTDGFAEAVDHKTGEAYGYDRLKKGLEKAQKTNAARIKKEMVTHFKHHVHYDDSRDDLTMLVIRFL